MPHRDKLSNPTLYVPYTAHSTTGPASPFPLLACNSERSEEPKTLKGCVENLPGPNRHSRESGNPVPSPLMREG